MLILASGARLPRLGLAATTPSLSQTRPKLALAGRALQIHGWRIRQMNTRYTEPGQERRYAMDEPGWAFAGYVHHVQSLLQGFRDAYRHAERRMNGETPIEFGPPIELRFATAAGRLDPVIEQWKVQLLLATEGQSIGGSIVHMTTALATSFLSIRKAAKMRDAVLSSYLAAKREHLSRREAKKVKGKRAGPRRPSPIPIARQLQQAEALVAQIETHWLLFDPVKSIVDRAVVPWEEFCHLARTLSDDLNEMVFRTTPDSDERHQRLARLSPLLDNDMFNRHDQAVRFALTDEVATRMHAACLRVRETGLKALENPLTMRPGGTWATLFGDLNGAVLALQELLPLIRRAVRQTRMLGVTSKVQFGEQAPPIKPSIVFDRVHRTISINGQVLTLSPMGAAVLQAIIKGRGQFVGGEQLKGASSAKRPDRVVKGLPDLVRALLETKDGPNGGTRMIDPTSIDMIGP